MVNKLFMLSLCLGVNALLTPLSGQDMQGQIMECNQELLVVYFPDQFVEKTLNKFDVPQAQRGAIKQELTQKDKEVVAIVEEKAERMDVNPLRDPSRRQEAVKIFRETLYDVFSKVMQNHGINDKEEIQAMLDDIQRQKAEYFSQCMEHSPARFPEEKQMPSPSQKREGQPPAGFSRQPRGPNTMSNTYHVDYEDEFYE